MSDRFVILAADRSCCTAIIDDIMMRFMDKSLWKPFPCFVVLIG